MLPPQPAPAAIGAMSAAAPVEISERALPPDYAPSFGNWTQSALFSADEAETLMRTLDDTERRLATGAELRPIEVEVRPGEAPVEGQVAEVEHLPPLDFPVFHVSSILYRNPQDWMLWINGQRVTPKRKIDGLRVTHVAPGQVTLVWKADNWKHRMQVWSDPDRKVTLSYLENMTARDASVRKESGAHTIRATLRANQTLVTAVPLIVEGNHSEMAMTLAPYQYQLPVDTADGQAAASAPPAKERAYSQRMVRTAIFEAMEAATAAAATTDKEQVSSSAPATPENTEVDAASPAHQEPDSAPPRASADAPANLNDVLNAASAPPATTAP